MNLWETPAAPVESYPDAIARATTDVICEVSPYFVGAALALPQTRLLSIPFLVFSATQCGADSSSVPQMPFAGGQCPGVSYRVRVRGVHVGNSSPPTVVHPAHKILTGPINGPVIREVPGEPGRIGLNLGVNWGPEQTFEWFTSINYSQPNELHWQSVTISELFRTDGGVDACGNPSGVAPSPENPRPVLPFTRPPSVEYVPYRLPSGVIVEVPVEIGEIVVSPTIEAPITITVNNNVLVLSPDLSLDPIDVLPGVDLDDILSAISAIAALLEALEGQSQKLDALLECACSEGTVAMWGGSCDSPEPLILPVEWSGQQGIAELIAVLSRLVFSSTNALCPAPPIQDVPEVFLGSFRATGVESEGFVEVDDPRYAALYVRVVDFSPELVANESQYPGASQRRYGVATWSGPSSGVGGGPPIYLFDDQTWVPLPVRRGAGRLRLLLRPGTEVRVFATGELNSPL